VPRRPRAGAPEDPGRPWSRSTRGAGATPMIRPRPGFIWGEARRRAQEPDREAPHGELGQERHPDLRGGLLPGSADGRGAPRAARAEVHVAMWLRSARWDLGFFVLPGLLAVAGRARPPWSGRDRGPARRPPSVGVARDGRRDRRGPRVGRRSTGSTSTRRSSADGRSSTRGCPGSSGSRASSSTRSRTRPSGASSPTSRCSTSSASKKAS